MHQSTCRGRLGARGGRRASAPGRRECRRRSSIGPACGRGGDSAGTPPRRVRRAQRQRLRPRSWRATREQGGTGEAGTMGGHGKHGDTSLAAGGGRPGSGPAPALGGAGTAGGARSARLAARPERLGPDCMKMRADPRAVHRRGSDPRSGRQEAAQAGRCWRSRKSGCTGGGVQGTRSRSAIMAAATARTWCRSSTWRGPRQSS